MTRRVDLFVGSDAPIGAVATAITRQGELEALPPAGDGSITFVGDGVVATLGEHDFPDGDELRLSGYRYVLSAAADVAGHLGGSPEALSLRRLAEGLGVEHPVLLVLDLPSPGRGRGDDPGAGVARSWEG